MKYEKAVAVVVEFDNSDVVTESSGENGGFSFEDAQALVGKCGIASLTMTCGSQAGDAFFRPN